MIPTNLSFPNTENRLKIVKNPQIRYWRNKLYEIIIYFTGLYIYILYLWWTNVTQNKCARKNQIVYHFLSTIIKFLSKISKSSSNIIKKNKETLICQFYNKEILSRESLRELNLFWVSPNKIKPAAQCNI